MLKVTVHRHVPMYVLNRLIVASIASMLRGQKFSGLTMNLFATFLGFLGFFKSREYGMYYLSGTTDLQYTNIIVG